MKVLIAIAVAAALAVAFWPEPEAPGRSWTADYAEYMEAGNAKREAYCATLSVPENWGC